MYERNPRTISILLCLLLGAAGAAGAAGMHGNATEAFPQDPAIDPLQGKPNWRWIGERTNTSMPCPPAPGWTAKPLFCDAASPSDPLYGPCTLDAPPIPPGLAPFCAYEFTALNTPVTASDKAALMNLKNTGQLSKLDPDSMGIAGFGSGMQDDIWEQLEDHVKQQTGLPDPLPLNPSPATLIRVAVVDTQPSGVDADDVPHRSNHGNALANLADELLCDDTLLCAATPVARLALGYVCPLEVDINRGANCRDPMNGGYIGTLGDLARAMRLETRAWIDPGASGRRLILNLSVAWHPRFGGLQPNISDMEAPVRAVYAAIADAQCRGALVIAAAGNITGGPESQNGPMLPAAWEQRPALTQAECQGRIAPTVPPNIFPPPGADHRPFVYAVAGVDGADLPLGNARPNSEPSFVAYGDHANVEDESEPGTVPTATLTGSSVSALVMSATAGWAWYIGNAHITPAPKPYEIMERLYNTGDKLPRSADFCLGGTSALPCPQNPLPQVTEVQICSVIDSILGTATCPTVVPLDLAFEDVGFFPVSLSLFSSTVSDQPCPQRVRFMPGLQLENPCPFSQYFSLLAEPWTVEPASTAPQPNDAPCPNCGGGHARVAALSRNARAQGVDQNLWIEIDDAREWVLTDAALQCGSELYAIGPYLVSKGLSPLGPGDKVKLLLDDGRCRPGSDMRIFFRDDSGESTVDTLLQAGSLDTDEDGIPDASDNCTEIVNADQRDTNGDGIGNVCDPDLTEDCIVNFADLGALEAVFFTNDPDADFDGSGSVNFGDLGVLKSFFFLPPGPSGVPNACSL